MINTYIMQYKQSSSIFNEKVDEQINNAFNGIYEELRQFIDYASSKYVIPGLNKDDMHALAMEQIYDCLQPRKLKRGVGEKTTLNENDCEQKNFNSLKNAIKYRFIREKRKTESNIVYSYNIDILDENGNQYLDREGKPLDIGINFVHGIAYLYSGNKRISSALNIPVVKNNRTIKSSTFSNPIDCSISFDFTTETDEDDNCELRDVLEFEYNKNIPNDLENALFNSTVIMKLYELQKKENRLSKKQLFLVNNLLKYSTNLNSLQQYVNSHKKNVARIKKDLKTVFNLIGVL